MKNTNENRAENFIRKHDFNKRWISIMLVVALLVTSVTMYSLNKSATAVSDETADQVGMVLNSDSSEDSASVESTDVEPAADENNTSVSEDTASNDEGDNAAESDSSFSEDSNENDSVNSDVENAENNSDSGNANSDVQDSSSALDEATDNNSSSNDADSENTGSSDDATEATTEESTSDDATTGDSTVDTENAEAEETELADGETSEEADPEAKLAESDAEEKELADGSEIELTEDVILTVSYVDTEGKAIADEKEISLTDSLDFTTEAPVQEGYTFKEATVDGTVITKITAKQDADEHRYYEVTLEDETTLEIKENKTVVLTYVAEGAEEEVAVEASIKLTAKYVDKEGTEIKEAAELNIAAETEFKKDNAEVIDGYFYMNASLEDKKVAKIAPVFEEEAAETENAEAEASETEQTDSEAAKKVASYEVTTVDGETISVTEDAEIAFNYVKASEETEFTSKNEKVTVSATVNQPGVFPEGIELKVTEINDKTEGYNYDAYMQAMNDNAEAIAEASGIEETQTYDENNTLLYDIAFMLDGVEYQPAAGAVNVKIEFNDKQLTDDLSVVSEDDITVVHLPIKAEVKEESEIVSTEEATEIKAEDIEVKPLTDATADVSEAEKIEFVEEGFSIFAVATYQNHAPGTDTYETVLGDAVTFGIVANKLHIKESQSNFATKLLVPQAQSGNNLTNPVEQTYIVADGQNGEFKVKGNDAYFLIPSNVNNITLSHENNTKLIVDRSYTKSELETAVNSMLEYVRKASADLAGRTANASLQRMGNPGGYYYVVNIQSKTGGTYYVDLYDDDLDNINQAGKLNILKNADQIIVFNVKASKKSVNLYKFNVTIGDNTYDTDTLESKGDFDYVNNSLIWNFINATSVTSQNSIVGVLISGQQNATYTNKGTSAGWVVFPEVVIDSGEWHNTYQKIKQVRGTAQFQAYKTIDGESSTKTGFEFKLSAKSGNQWNAVQTVTNSSDTPQNVVFEPITFYEIKNGNESYSTSEHTQSVRFYNNNPKDFIYCIEESYGEKDSEGNSYTKDENKYYVKVTVTKQTYGNTSYLHVSVPQYYKDKNCKNKITEQFPTFNNKPKGKLVQFELNKLLNGKDPGNAKFGFSIRVLNSSGRLVLLDGDKKNNGDKISVELYASSEYIYKTGGLFNKVENVFFVITENSNQNTNDVTTDGSYIIVRAYNLNNSNPSYEYFRVSEEDIDKYGDVDEAISHLEDNYKNERKYYTGYTYYNHIGIFNYDLINFLMKYFKLDNQSEATFYNTTPELGSIQIHKILDIGKGYFGDLKGYLSKLKFKITRISDNHYIVFSLDNDNKAIEYDASHNKVKEYTVTYNKGAKWTISGLPVGDYRVEEVADGYTFSYDSGTNTSSDINSDYVRVTSYVVNNDNGKEYATTDPITVHIGSDSTNLVTVWNDYKKPTKLTIQKVWNDMNGETLADSDVPCEKINVTIWRKTVDSDEWSKFKDDQIYGGENKWKLELKDLDSVGDDGTPYIYCVTEQELTGFLVTYKYENKEYIAEVEEANSSEENATSVETVSFTAGDEPYEPSANTDGTFGTFTITNKSVYTNVLPATGSSGTTPFTVGGLGVMGAAILTSAFYGIRKKREDEE